MCVCIHLSVLHTFNGIERPGAFYHELEKGGGPLEILSYLYVQQRPPLTMYILNVCVYLSRGARQVLNPLVV